MASDTNWDYVDRDGAVDEAIRLQQQIDNHVCDHTNCIPRSELPGLPKLVTPPFKVVAETATEFWRVCDSSKSVYGTKTDRTVARCVYQDEAECIAAMLNLTTCYPAPTATKEG